MPAHVRPDAKDAARQVLWQPFDLDGRQSRNGGLGILSVPAARDLAQRGLRRSHQPVAESPADDVLAPTDVGILGKLTREPLDTSARLVEIVRAQSCIDRGQTLRQAGGAL